mgnify:CR=1 FL=1
MTSWIYPLDVWPVEWYEWVGVLLAILVVFLDWYRFVWSTESKSVHSTTTTVTRPRLIINTKAESTSVNNKPPPPPTAGPAVSLFIQKVPRPRLIINNDDDSDENSKIDSRGLSVDLLGNHNIELDKLSTPVYLPLGYRFKINEWILDHPNCSKLEVINMIDNDKEFSEMYSEETKKKLDEWFPNLK